VSALASEAQEADEGHNEIGDAPGQAQAAQIRNEGDKPQGAGTHGRNGSSLWKE
jgi:hypothetical protein